MDNAARRRFAYPKRDVPPTGKPSLPDRKHTYHNGPVCIGPPDGDKRFRDAGLEESNVIHGPLMLRGPIKLDGSAALSLFHELYSDPSIFRNASSEPSEEPSFRNFENALEHVSEWLREKLSKPQPTKPDTSLSSSQTSAPTAPKEIWYSLGGAALEWDPTTQDGLPKVDFPKVGEIALPWKLDGSDARQTFELSAPNATAFSVRGKISFVSPDPLGHRVLYAVRKSDASRKVLAVAAAQLSRNGSLPDSLHFEASFAGWTSDDAVEIRLARRPEGGLCLVRTDSRLVVTVV